MTAAARWTAALEAWALPEELLEAAEENPYGWSQELWRRRSEIARSRPEPGPTLERVRALAGPPPADVLDVGAGRGRASLPLASEGYRVVAVERDEQMADGLAEEAGAADVRIVRGRWPEVADAVERVDVAMCAHVVYDVHDIARFLVAMIDRARRGVVIELSETHPWSGLAPYFRALHGIDLPEGPTASDLVDVVEELTGRTPHVDRWDRPGGVWFTAWDEIEAHYGRRLLLTRDRRPELRGLLPVVEEGGRLYVGDDVRRMATVWFET